jgi:hypothetical protein
MKPQLTSDNNYQTALAVAASLSTATTAIVICLKGTGHYYAEHPENQSDRGNLGNPEILPTTTTTKYGEWLQITMPSAIYVDYYIMAGRSNDAGRFPAEWYLVGSNDAGSNWYLLNSGTNSVSYSTAVFHRPDLATQ